MLKVVSGNEPPISRVGIVPEREGPARAKATTYGERAHGKEKALSFSEALDRLRSYLPSEAEKKKRFEQKLQG